MSIRRVSAVGARRRAGRSSIVAAWQQARSDTSKRVTWRMPRVPARKASRKASVPNPSGETMPMPLMAIAPALGAGTAAAGAGAASAEQPMAATLMPPNAAARDMKWSKRAGRDALGTTSRSQPVRDSAKFSVGGRKPAFMPSNDAMNSSTPAPPSVWPKNDFDEETGGGVESPYRRRIATVSATSLSCVPVPCALM